MGVVGAAERSPGRGCLCLPALNPSTQTIQGKLFKSSEPQFPHL